MFLLLLVPFLYFKAELADAFEHVENFRLVLGDKEDLLVISLEWDAIRDLENASRDLLEKTVRLEA